VLKHFRTRYLGKASPVHVFWGSFDMAVLGMPPIRRRRARAGARRPPGRRTTAPSSPSSYCPTTRSGRPAIRRQPSRRSCKAFTMRRPISAPGIALPSHPFPFPSKGDITLTVRNANYTLGPVMLHLVMKLGAVVPRGKGSSRLRDPGSPRGTSQSQRRTGARRLGPLCAARQHTPPEKWRWVSTRKRGNWASKNHRWAMRSKARGVHRLRKQDPNPRSTSAMNATTTATDKLNPATTSATARRSKYSN
jgi:uncharacterized protein DUF5996